MTTTCCIASYHYGHLAAHCIDTVLSQTVPFDHVMLTDDAVGDCSHLDSIYPEVAYYKNSKRLGIVENFNAMLQNTRTDRVMFLGADNWLRQDTMEILSRSNADIVTYDIQILGEFMDEMPLKFRSRKQHGGYYWDRSDGHHGSMLYSVPKAKAAGGYASLEGADRSCEDLVLYRRMIQAGAVREHIPEALLYYRRHRKNYHDLTKPRR